MEHPAGELDGGSLRVDFDRRLKPEFHGSRITSDAGILVHRELDDAIARLNDEVSVELANTTAALRAAYRLRYQVYCLERGFLAGQNGVERDEYDDHARHAVVRWRQTGEVVGAVRLVLPKVPPVGDDFPVQHVCDPALLRGLPRATTGELSRFALAKQQTKQVRGVSVETSSLLRLALLRGGLWLSAEAGHSHWVAVMRPALLRLFRTSGLHFVPLGPLVEYHGLRQPAVAELAPTMARMAREQPAVWDYLTRGGAWYSAPPPRSSRGLEALAAARADSAGECVEVPPYGFGAPRRARSPCGCKSHPGNGRLAR